MDQDWQPVVLRKTRTAGVGKAKAQKEDLTHAVRSGAEIQTHKKFAAGSNRATGASNAKALDAETEDFAHKEIPHEFKVALVKARQAKSLTQKDLGKLINETPNLISQYERGTVIPNGAIIAKLNRSLGTTLPKIPKKKVIKDDS